MIWLLQYGGNVVVVGVTTQGFDHTEWWPHEWWPHGVVTT